MSLPSPLCGAEQPTFRSAWIPENATVSLTDTLQLNLDDFKDHFDILGWEKPLSLLLLLFGIAWAKLSLSHLLGFGLRGRGGAQGNEPSTFARWEWVKELRKHSELNKGVYRPWKESRACCPGMRLGKTNGTGWCHCPSWVTCRSITWRRSCTWGGLQKALGFGVLKPTVIW